MEKFIGRRFQKTRHGITQVVTLEEIRRDKVKLREVDHDDGFVLPMAKFQKFYTLLE